MNGTEVRAAFEAVLAAWNARDLDAFCAQLAPDIYWHDLGMPNPPAVGHEAVRRFSRSIFGGFPDFRYELRGALCIGEDGNSCVAPFRLRATFTGVVDPPGFAPTGRRVDIEGLEYLQFRDGLVTRIETRFDPFELFRQLFAIDFRPPAGSRRERASVRLQKSHAWWLRRTEAAKPPAV